MADILIRGIELPTAEEEARLILITRTGRAIDMLCEEYEAIPDHGRLIDADALLSDVKQNSASYFADDFAHEWVDVAPTVIPASGKE